MRSFDEVSITIGHFKSINDIGILPEHKAHCRKSDDVQSYVVKVPGKETEPAGGILQ